MRVIDDGTAPFHHHSELGFVHHPILSATCQEDTRMLRKPNEMVEAAGIESTPIFVSLREPA